MMFKITIFKLQKPDHHTTPHTWSVELSTFTPYEYGSQRMDRSTALIPVLVNTQEAGQDLLQCEYIFAMGVP